MKTMIDVNGRGGSGQGTVVVLGAGLAGLSAAHELSRLGYAVSVYEATAGPGGFFRSGRRPGDHMPTEYSWHGMGPWYHNTFDVMKQIPFSNEGSVYDCALSRPIDFGIFPNRRRARFYDKGLRSIPGMFGMRGLDFVRWSYLMLKTWTSRRRGQKVYSRINAASAWKPLLSEVANRTWRACFGPWIGSDWSRVSLHTAGEFFRKQLTTRTTHEHRADQDGPAWTHGAGDGWLLLRGPSSEWWFDPWVANLERSGVRFHWIHPLTHLDFDGTRIVSAQCGAAQVQGNQFILAINPFMAAQVLARTPELAAQDGPNRFERLTQDSPHAQISFRLSFAEKIRFPRPRTAVVVSDSEFNLTLFAEEQAWSPSVDLGDGILSLWTGTSCISTVPGRVYGKDVQHCTKAEFIAEVRAQILECGALDVLIRQANDGRGLGDFPIASIEVWHEWEFTGTEVRSAQPKWVNSTSTEPNLPDQTTAVANLFLAGAHTRTEAQVWSIEGAVESGRRAAKAIDDRVQVLGQERPWWVVLTATCDDALYAIGAPQLIDSLLLLLGLLLGLLLVLGCALLW
ncbi:MAG: FAD-dependent oxidoreductase [Planctomycetota bacterium]|nr:FAD-dependent oxidoreductase [Planctomycetota bacterium]